MGKKIFEIQAKNKITFLLSIFGASVTNTFKVVFKNIIKISSTLSLQAKFLASIVLRKSMKITFSKISLNYNIPINLKTGKLRVVASGKLTGKITSNVINKITILERMKLREKWISAIDNGSITLGANNMVLGHFYTLGYYDPSTLAALDSQTLGAMDFDAT